MCIAQRAPGSLNRYLKITLYRAQETILPHMNDRIRSIFSIKSTVYNLLPQINLTDFEK